MRKFTKRISIIMLPVFVCAALVSCTPSQVSTAKATIAQAGFYVDMAEALIRVASTQFANNPLVAASLGATAQALATVRKAMDVAVSGLDKDQAALRAALVSLAIEVFSLAKAIRDAQAAAKTASNP